MDAKRPETEQWLGVDSDDVSGDYTYDMAHDAGPDPDQHLSERPHPVHGPQTVDVPPPDPDGDYSYDLAHDVPRAER